MANAMAFCEHYWGKSIGTRLRWKIHPLDPAKITLNEFTLCCAGLQSHSDAAPDVALALQR
jgi:hypothetical protein